MNPAASIANSPNPSNAETVNVEFVRTELVKLLPRYQTIRDVINNDIKDKGEEYLPDPSEHPYSRRTPEEIQRYKNYKLRAVFINFTARAQMGFVGQIFARDPETEVPKSLEALVKNATGDGLSLEQLCKDAAADVLALGRYGFFIDYPQTNGAVTREQMDSGEIRPTIIPYTAENIINWRTIRRDALNVLSLVVLKEQYAKRDDGFEPVFDDQYRVLELDKDGFYRQRVYRSEDGFGDRDSQPIVNGARPRDIPFTFIGSVNNDPTPDNPPMFDMAELNIGHYRNSADREESVFLCGQPTFVVTGITEHWLTKTLGGVIRFGARFGLPLQKEASAEIIQADPNGMVTEAMEHKEKQIAAMGADFLKDQNVAKTATEAAIDDSSRTSIVSNSAKNLSAAVLFALEWAALFQGEREDSVSFKLNSEFDLTKLNPQDIDALIKARDAKLLSFKETRDRLRKGGMATENDDTVKAENEKESAQELERVAAEFGINNPDVTGNQPPMQRGADE